MLGQMAEEEIDAALRDRVLPLGGGKAERVTRLTEQLMAEIEEQQAQQQEAAEQEAGQGE
jgi:molybdenum-dependent DNA-binding transcriptional regulator ModE